MIFAQDDTVSEVAKAIAKFSLPSPLFMCWEDTIPPLGSNRLQRIEHATLHNNILTNWFLLTLRAKAVATVCAGVGEISPE